MIGHLAQPHAILEPKPDLGPYFKLQEMAGVGALALHLNLGLVTIKDVPAEELPRQQQELPQRRL